MLLAILLCALRLMSVSSAGFRKSKFPDIPTSGKNRPFFVKYGFLSVL